MLRLRNADFQQLAFSHLLIVTAGKPYFDAVFARGHVLKCPCLRCTVICGITVQLILNVGFVEARFVIRRRRVDDLDAMYQELSRQGVEFVSPPVTIDAGANTGAKGLYLRDPDGFTIELFQPKP